MFHKNAELGDRHPIHNFEYADAAARAAATGFASGDLNKLALQLDDGSYWRLDTTAPAWVAFGLNGADGTNGTPGAQGPQGPAGVNGVNGVDGAPGAQGPQGPAGADGTGAGDMLLGTAQTVTAAKTFNNAMMLLRNVANTFSSWFTNTNTAARTYTLPDKNGTVAMTSDIPTTLPASDVSAWAKAATKPAYTAAEVGAPAGSGSSTGANTGDQTTIVGISGTIAQFNTACSDADFATGGGTATGSNTGDQTLGGLGAEATANKNASNGYVGLTLLKIAMKNVAGTFTSFFTNTNSAARTYTLPDKDGTVAMTSDITGTNSGTNTGDQTSIVGITGTIAQFNTAVTDENLVGQATADTLTNKRITLRVGSTTSSATPTINTDVTDIYKLTAQTADITSFTTNLTGTPVDGDAIIIEITGTAARAITWGTSFEASTVALPTTTVSTTMLAVAFLWNTATSKWRCVAAV